VLSTQVLLESGAEVGTMHKIAANGNFLVEANDMGAVQRLAGKLPFVAGPQLNLYNLPSLQWMASLGARRWVMPLEMKKDDLAVLQALFDAVRTQALAPHEALARMQPFMLAPGCNGYWHGRPGLEQIRAVVAA